MSTQSATQTTQSRAQKKTRRRRGAPRKDLYQSVTDTVIAQLEAGTVPWVQPWGRPDVTAPCTLPQNARPPAPHLIG